MRILYVTSENINRRNGGIVHFLAVAGCLGKLGHDLHIMAPQYFKELDRPKDIKGIFIRVPGRSYFTFILFQLLAALTLPYLRAKYRIDVILVRNSPGLFILFYLVARLFKVRIVLEVNGNPFGKELTLRGFPPWVESMIKLVAILEYKIANRIITVTPVICSDIIRVASIPESKIFPIQNGADPEEFNKRDLRIFREMLGIRQDTFVIGYIGLFIQWHGVSEIIRSAGIIKTKGDYNIHYVLAGDGEGFNDAKELIKKENLEDMISLPGPVARQDVPNCLASFDVGIYIGKGDRVGMSSPLKLWEYFAAGLPVIISDDPALTPIINENNMGLILSEPTPEIIAREILMMYQHQKKFKDIGIKNRELSKKEFNWLEVARKVQDVLAKK